MKLIAAAAALVLAGSAFAEDIVTLRDGRTFSGTLLTAGSGVVTFRDNTGARQQFNQRDVRSIEFD